MIDPEGRPLISARGYDPLQHRLVWAVYKFQLGYSSAEARVSDFVGFDAAKRAADDLNGSQDFIETHYFRVCRLSDQ